MTRMIAFWLTLFLLNPAVADGTLVLRSWGSPQTASDRHIALSVAYAPTGLTLLINAGDKASGIKQVKIQGGSKILATCLSYQCNYLWPVAAMAASNDMVITATNNAGTSFLLATKLYKP